MNKHRIDMIGLFVAIITLGSCTTIFFAQNRTGQIKQMKIVYKNSDTAKDDRTGYYQKRGVIENVMKKCEDQQCVLTFDLLPQKNLPLTTILHMSDLSKDPMEERIIYAGETNMILHKSGTHFKVNKFESKAKLFSLVGKKTFVYYYR